MGHYDEKGNAVVGNIAIPASYIAEFRKLLNTVELPRLTGWYVGPDWEPEHSSVFRLRNGVWTEITPGGKQFEGERYVEHLVGNLIQLVPASSGKGPEA